MTFNQNGVLSTFDKGTATGSSCCQVGGDGAYQDASMASPSKSTQAFGRFDYDLTDDIHVYVQGALNLKRSVSYTGWNQLAGITLGADNAYLDPAYQAELAAAGQSTFHAQRDPEAGARASRTSRRRPNGTSTPGSTAISAASSGRRPTLTARRA